ncbi:MAG: cytosolic protein [Candidatus Contendobacter sp.]|nr:MAG: cytosolic protein [Candidatus Contendobacter sp.]
MTGKGNEYDSPWKQLLERFFPEFMAFFFQDAHGAIDWEAGYEFLDKELARVVRDATLGQRYADKLVRVRRCEGGESLVLVHIEVQGRREAAFAQRMYVYHYRLYDRYARRTHGLPPPVVSLAVLADEEPGWRPREYGYALWGCELNLRFPVVKLLDYTPRQAELETAANPFALVVLAQLWAMSTRQNPPARYDAKLHLLRLLYRRGYDRQNVLDLLNFIDWLLHLPPELEQRLWSAVDEFEEEKTMQYVTSLERMATERGLQQGLQQGMQQGAQQGMRNGMAQTLRRQLARRFGPLPEWVLVKLVEASQEDLECWTDRILEATSLEAVFEL